MPDTTIGRLREQVRGEVISPEDAGYDAARRVYNAMIDRRPRVIVRARDAADVIATVVFARDHALDLSVRGGGHSVPGFGTNDGGLVIDLSLMRGVRVDPKARTARVEGGATWGDFNHAGYPFGLATTGGIISTTGVGGLTLGGGIGYLSRGCGLTIDNLLSADVVTADGTLKTASATEHPDLFWALRGGGGNFGVVTSFEFRMHPVKDIYGGPIFFEADHAADVLRFFRKFIVEAPEAFGGFPAWQIAPPLPFIPTDRHGETFIAMVTCWAGPLDQGPRVIEPIRHIAPVVAEHVGPMPYPALNSAFDALVPAGLQHYWKAAYATELSDPAIAAHVEHGRKVPYVSSTVHLYPINGACHRVGQAETAFGHREATFAAVIAGMWANPADNDANRTWVKDYYAAIAPYSDEGGYINFTSADDQVRAPANFGANYKRLVEAKRVYDPDNLFHMNQNIVP
jgi:FAD/FMN-containing dehydrogenase